MSDTKLQGVGGWLRFLTIYLTWILPIGALTGAGVPYLLEQDYPELQSFPAWGAYKGFLYIIIFCAALLSIYAGRCLEKKNDKKTLKKVILIIWILNPGVVLFLSLICTIYDLEFIAGSYISSVPKLIIMSLILTLYLKKSKRVQNTYINDFESEYLASTTIVNPDTDNDKKLIDSNHQGYINFLNSFPRNSDSKTYIDGNNSKNKFDVKNITNIDLNFEKVNNTLNSDEQFYLIATEEVDQGQQHKAAWAKCMALCEGDEGKAKYKYIKERVDRLRDEKMRAIEEERREEILKNRTEDERKEILIQNKMNFYLNPENEEKLKVLLSRSKIYYEMHSGSYRVRLENNYVVHFKDFIKFHDFLKQKLPTLDGFNAN